MDVTPLIPEGHLLIEAYGGGGFRIAHQRLEGGVILSPLAVFSFPFTDFAAVTEADIAPLFTLSPAPEMVLLGMGEHFQPCPPHMRQWLRARHITVDAMDTGAACRTYNILMGEGRRVAAILLPM